METVGRKVIVFLFVLLSFHHMTCEHRRTVMGRWRDWWRGEGSHVDWHVYGVDNAYETIGDYMPLPYCIAPRALPKRRPTTAEADGRNPITWSKTNILRSLPCIIRVCENDVHDIRIFFFLPVLGYLLVYRYFLL